MVEISYPSEVKTKIDKLRGRLSLIESTSLSYNEAKKFLDKEFRDSFSSLLLDRNVSYIKSKLNSKNFINLTQVETRRKLEQNYVVIKVGEFITPIRISENIVMTDNFNNYEYCIVKEGISQYIDEACEFDKNLYYILKKYCFLREAYKIKVGDVVKVKGKSYNFTVENIVSDTAYLVNAFGSKQTANKSLLVHAQTPKFEKIIPKKITL